MKIEELIKEEMYVLVAPDGSPQTMTLAPEYAMCIGLAQMLAKTGVCQPLDKLFKQGYEVMPVRVTMKQDGSAEDGFKKAKRKTSKINK